MAAFPSISLIFSRFDSMLSMLVSETAVSTTPILDSGVLPRGRSIVRKIVMNLLGVVIGICLGIAVGHIVRVLPGHFSFFTFLGIFILAITLHECGHLAVGWMVGFHFSSFSVGPLSIRIEYGKMKVYFRGVMLAAGYAGMHIDRVRRVRRRMLLYIAGGPIANLICALVSKLLINYVFIRPGRMQPILGEFMLISLILGLANLIPFGFTDGGRILMLLFFREKSRRWISTIAVGSLQRKGIRPKLWKQSWIKAATVRKDSSWDELNASLLAYVSAVDNRDAISAGKHLETSLKLAPLFRFRRDLTVQEAVYFAAWFRSNTALAEKWRAQIKKPNHLTRLQRIRLDVAVSSSKNDFDTAIKSWHEGSDFIETLPVTPIRKQIEISWQEWRGEILERQQQLVPA